MIRKNFSLLFILSGVAAVCVTSTLGVHGIGTVSLAAAATQPIKIGSQIAGSFADATGHSGQSHFVYAANGRRT